MRTAELSRKKSLTLERAPGNMIAPAGEAGKWGGFVLTFCMPNVKTCITLYDQRKGKQKQRLIPKGMKRCFIDKIYIKSVFLFNPVDGLRF